jgi:hypothetical protein
VTDRNNRRSAEENPGINSPLSPQTIQPEYTEPSVPDWMFKVVDINRKNTSVRHQNSQDNQTESTDSLEDRIRKSDRWMIILTAVITVATVANVIVFWLDSRETSKQIEKLIAQATKQATAAGKQAANTETLAVATSDLATAAVNQVKELKGVVKATEASVNAKESIRVTQDNIRLDQRAWVGPIAASIVTLKEGTNTNVKIEFKNSGKTPAIKLENRVGLVAYRSDTKFVPRYDLPRVTIQDSISVVQPSEQFLINAESHGVATERIIADIKNETIIYYIFGVLTYEDIFHQPHYTHFCFYVATSLKELTNCSTYNDAK